MSNTSVSGIVLSNIQIKNIAILCHDIWSIQVGYETRRKVCSKWYKVGVYMVSLVFPIHEGPPEVGGYY